MEKATGHKMKLGIFVSISLTLFIAGIYFIGRRQQLFNSTFQVSGIFKDINGLEIGNNVRFSGINIGIIDNIQQVTDSTVKVDMMIREESRKFIKKNAKAVIGSDGLMGNKLVIITPGTPGRQQVSDNDFIEATQAVSMDAVLAKLKVTVDNAASISGDLAGIMKNIHEGKGTIGKLFMDSVLAKTVDEAMTNIRQGAGGFKQNMTAASHNFLLKGYFKKKKKETDEKEK